MPSKSDNRRVSLLTTLGGTGLGKTNMDLEREAFLREKGLTPVAGSKLSIADLGYRENKALSLDPVTIHNPLFTSSIEGYNNAAVAASVVSHDPLGYVVATMSAAGLMILRSPLLPINVLKNLIVRVRLQTSIARDLTGYFEWNNAEGNYFGEGGYSTRGFVSTGFTDFDFTVTPSTAAGVTHARLTIIGNSAALNENMKLDSALVKQ